MNTKKLLSLWGLKWNPFSPELPGDGLLLTPKIDHFAWRVEQLVQEGGFALITGEPGTGKSVALRIVAQRLSTLRDVVVTGGAEIGCYCWSGWFLRCCSGLLSRQQRTKSWTTGLVSLAGGQSNGNAQRSSDEASGLADGCHAGRIRRRAGRRR